MSKKNIAVLVSGGGTNLESLIKSQKTGMFGESEITSVISSKSGVYALERAERNGIKTRVIERRLYGDIKSYSKDLTSALKKENADLVVLAGFLTVFDEQVFNAFPYKIINIHPSLIPSFCGIGYYGLHVHEEALKRGVKISGATVHFVVPECDAGPIILQKAVEVKEGDTPGILQKRIMEEAEWKILPLAVKLFCEDRITIKDGKTYINKL